MSESQILRDTLLRNEEIIRAFDIKTEIAMLCFILSVEAAHSLSALDVLGTTRPFLSGLLFILFIAALVGYLLVLLPIQNPKLREQKSGGIGSDAARAVYFISDPQNISADELVRSLACSDQAYILAYEILKLSAIRNAKRRRFLGALSITVAFYAVLLVVRFAD